MFYIKGPTVDRFCGGQLNTETNKDYSIPIYCEVASNVIWMQVNCILYDILFCFIINVELFINTDGDWNTRRVSVVEYTFNK